MNVFVVARYVIKSTNWQDFIPSTKRRLKYMKENPAKFKEMKSWKLLSPDLNGKAGEYVEIWEFESFAEYQKWHERATKDKEYMKILNKEFMPLIVDSTWSRELWAGVM